MQLRDVCCVRVVGRVLAVLRVACLYIYLFLPTLFGPIYFGPP